MGHIDAMTNEQDRWTPHSQTSINTCALQGLLSMCFRDQHYWKMVRHLVFDIYIEEYAVHRVMRQFGHYQASPVPVMHTLSMIVHT
jgi:hypothetical protein